MPNDGSSAGGVRIEVEHTEGESRAVRNGIRNEIVTSSSLVVVLDERGEDAEPRSGIHSNALSAH